MFSLIALWTIGGKYRRTRRIIYHNDLHPPRLFSKFAYLLPVYPSVAFTQHRNIRFFQSGNDPLVSRFGMLRFPAFQKMRRMGVKHPASNHP